MKQLCIAIFGLLISSAAFAQDYGLTIGVHQTSAAVDTAGSTNYSAITAGSANSSLGYDLGLTASFELMPDFRFRSGVLYNVRPFEYKVTAPAGAVGTFTFKYSYLDVPVNVQYNVTPMIGIYGGMIVAIKAGESVSTPSTVTMADSGTGMKSLYPLFNVGTNFMFNDMIGFDLYYEMGSGSFSEIGKNYSNFGMHFIYWL